MRIDVVSHKFVIIYSFKQRVIKIIKAVIYNLLNINKSLTAELTNKILNKYTDEDQYLLDVGSGMGDFLFDSSNIRKSNNSMFIGLDCSKHMISHSHAKYRHKANNIAFLVGDVAALPFKSSSIDMVWLNWIIHHLNRDIEAKALTEAIRVAKKSVIIRDVHREDCFFGKIVSLYWKCFDGGYNYRSINEWVTYIGEKNIIDKQKGSYPDFIIEVSTQKKLKNQS